MVHSEVLDKLPSENLQVYAVWEPILRTDDERAARKATTLLPDARVLHYWVDDADVGEMFQKPIHLSSEPAWDVYLVYPRGVTWEGETPPEPEHFMHQLRGRLLGGKRLDGPELAQWLETALAR